MHVIGDMRGTGDSGGVMVGNYNFGGVPQGQELYDLIEWVAAQPWCDGNVGMIGISYFGSMQVPHSAMVLRWGPDLVVLGCRPSIGAGGRPALSAAHRDLWLVSDTRGSHVRLYRWSRPCANHHRIVSRQLDPRTHLYPMSPGSRAGRTGTPPPASGWARVFVVSAVSWPPSSCGSRIVGRWSADSDPFSSEGVCGQGPGCRIEGQRDGLGPETLRCLYG